MTLPTPPSPRGLIPRIVHHANGGRPTPLARESRAGDLVDWKHFAPGWPQVFDSLTIFWRMLFINPARIQGPIRDVDTSRVSLKRVDGAPESVFDMGETLARTTIGLICPFIAGLWSRNNAPNRNFTWSASKIPRRPMGYSLSPQPGNH